MSNPLLSSYSSCFVFTKRPVQLKTVTTCFQNRPMSFTKRAPKQNGGCLDTLDPPLVYRRTYVRRDRHTAVLLQYCCRLSPVGRTNALLTITVMSEFASHAPTVAAVWPSVKTCPGSVRATASVHAGRVRVECRMLCAAAPCRPNRFHYMDFFCGPGLRETPLGPCGSPTKSVRVRSGPCSGI